MFFPANRDQPRAVLIASGSEVSLILAAQEALAEEGIQCSVVSMPSWELFREQPQGYRDEVLPPGVKARLAVEAGVPMGWSERVGDAGDVIGMTISAPPPRIKKTFKHYGFTVENVIARTKQLLRIDEH